MNPIPDINGQQYNNSDPGYPGAQKQYATSSYPDRNLDPGLIIYPADVQAISTVVKYASTVTKDHPNRQAIAVRTGGHQYSGASSTTPDNIQLDLSLLAPDPDSDNDFQITLNSDGRTANVHTSIKWKLKDFINMLSDQHCFVPTGQCTDVHLGGHIQTGGYGQMTRSFGLLADNVMAFYVVGADGKQQTVKRDDPDNSDLFFGLLGGSPGNLGVITHTDIRVYQDKGFAGSHALWALHRYTPAKLEKLLGILTKMSDNGKAKNYDLCINVKQAFKLWDYGAHDEELDRQLGENLPEGFNASNGYFDFSVITVYAQWVKLSPGDQAPDQDWWLPLREGCLLAKPLIRGSRDMSTCVQWWLFDNPREFPQPYVKRTLTTDSATLGVDKDNWPKLMTNHLDKVLNKSNGLNICTQIQCHGGALVENANKGLTKYYAWRKDSTLGMTCDVFYENGHEQDAVNWQKETDAMIGANGVFAKTPRALLWGSFGEWDMEKDDPNFPGQKVWQKYYEDEKIYDEIKSIRKKYDPNGTFTPNPCCVPRAL